MIRGGGGSLPGRRFSFRARGMPRGMSEQKQENAADPDEGEEGGGAAESAREEEEEVEQAKQEMSELEEGEPPKDLADWPGGKAKYLTYGGPDGGESYDDGATSKLGPSSLRHHEDGSVTIEGEEVDDPDEYKGEPIPGGPSDPDAPPDPAMVGEEDDDMSDDDDSSDDKDSSDDDESSDRDS
jgi:hypothetical protein